MVNVYALKKTLVQLVTPYFILNSLISILHPVLRFTPGICELVSNDCHVDFYDYEIYFFVICVVAIKNRRCVSIESYLSTFFIFAKAGAMVLFYKMNVQMCVWYCVLCIVVMVTVRTPTLVESPEMKYFVDDSLPQLLKEDKTTLWIIEFYTSFSPHCNAVKPIFGALSREYTHENVKFGKCDVLKCPGVSELYGISHSCIKTELPAIVVFEEGKAAARVKQTMNGKPYKMSYENIKKDLLLPEFYEKAIQKTKKLKSEKKSK